MLTPGLSPTSVLEMRVQQHLMACGQDEKN